MKLFFIIFTLLLPFTSYANSVSVGENSLLINGETIPLECEGDKRQVKVIQKSKTINNRTESSTIIIVQCEKTKEEN